MGNPIQYCNTDNPSQIGGVCPNSGGGFVTTTYCCEPPKGLSQLESHCGMPPWGMPHNGGGVNENFAPSFVLVDKGFP